MMKAATKESIAGIVVIWNHANPGKVCVVINPTAAAMR